VTVFITAPMEELERRLRERATESSGEIEERLRVAGEQLAVAPRFDRVIENDDLDRAAAELVELVRGLLAPAGTISRQ
jgi:guanylate kinase